MSMINYRAPSELFPSRSRKSRRPIATSAFRPLRRRFALQSRNCRRSCCWAHISRVEEKRFDGKRHSGALR